MFHAQIHFESNVRKERQNAFAEIKFNTPHVRETSGVIVTRTEGQFIESFSIRNPIQTEEFLKLGFLLSDVMFFKITK